MALTRPSAAQLSSTKVDFSDPLFRINKNQLGTNNKDLGIIFERGSDVNVGFIWDESKNQFALIDTAETGNTAGDVIINSYADMHIGTLTASGITYPSSDGDTGQFLKTDGSGNLTFAAVTAAPGGNNTQVQYNNNGLLAGNSNLTFDGITLSTNTLSVTSNVTVSGNISVSGTVDGRNVAADGNKLDGIETGAKNDQTITAGTGLVGGGTGDVTLDVDTSAIATRLYVDNKISNLVDSSPSTLDTLNELAAALGDDPNFATTVSNQIGTKLGVNEKAADADKLDGLNSSQFLRSDSNDTINAGINTSLTILSADSGSSTIQLIGNNQGTGRVYVGQSTTYGGGIEYNGDDSPSTTGAGSDYVTLWRRSAGTDYWTARNKHSNNNWEFRADVSADNFNGTASSSRYADLAENYVADQDYPVGTVLDIGGENEVTIATKNSHRIAGTVSDNPGYLMNSALIGKHVTPVAYIGRVPCRVIGKIETGDILIVGDVPGVAETCRPADILPGQAVGKALESYNSKNEGIIEIMIGRL